MRYLTILFAFVCVTLWLNCAWADPPHPTKPKSIKTKPKIAQDLPVFHSWADTVSQSSDPKAIAGRVVTTLEPHLDYLTGAKPIDSSATNLIYVKELWALVQEVARQRSAQAVINDLKSPFKRSDAMIGLKYEIEAAATANSELSKTLSELSGLESSQRVKGFRTVQYRTIPILYGTDRMLANANDYNNYYGHKRDALQCGTVVVSIPSDHAPGAVERPDWKLLQVQEDPLKHIVVQKITPVDDSSLIAELLRNEVDMTDENSALVYVHGYNSTFAEAARRAAQLAYDLNYPGVPMLFSWPSAGDLPDYATDEAACEWSAPDLETFLIYVAESGVQNINLIAHSMGNRALTYALMRIHAQYPELVFNQIILAAPDIDAGVFTDQIVPAIRDMAVRVTLYASDSDKAIMLSHGLHAFPRAGCGGECIIVADGLDTIEATGIDTSLLGMGHNYFAESRVLIADLISVLNDNLEPSERQLQPQGGGFWALK